MASRTRLGSEIAWFPLSSEGLWQALPGMGLIPARPGYQPMNRAVVLPLEEVWLMDVYGTYKDFAARVYKPTLIISKLRGLTMWLFTVDPCPLHQSLVWYCMIYCNAEHQCFVEDCPHVYMVLALRIQP